VIEPDLLTDLPENDDEAFVKIARAAIERLRSQYESSWMSNSNEPPVHAERQFVATVMAAIRELDIHELADWDPNGSDMPTRFVDDVERVVQQLMIRHSRRDRKYTVAFDPATKQKLHHYLNQIREIVDKSADSKSKKDALRDCIAALAAEIDSSRSGYEKFADLVASLAGLTADAWEKVSPMVKTLMGTVDAAKSEEDAQARLPSPVKKKQIEPPREKKGGTFPELVDGEEIPF
jgi:hypothetical protein